MRCKQILMIFLCFVICHITNVFAQETSLLEIEALSKEIIQLKSKQMTSSLYENPYGSHAVRGVSPAVEVEISDDEKKPFTIKGELRLGVGITSSNVTFRQANMDLNELNWRNLNYEGQNNGPNTFDPGVYQRLKVEMDAGITNAISMHVNLVADPWSYTAKSSTKQVCVSAGNCADVTYYYTAATNYTIGQIVDTNMGSSISLPEIHKRHKQVTVDGIDHDISGLDYTFNPLRELWFDIKMKDDDRIRIFPMAYQDQAPTTSDPLRLSNNKTYWESSPWLRGWQRGKETDNNFYIKGKWEKALSSYKDSDGTSLTALRGVSMDLTPNEGGSIKATVATPKHLWQDYDEITAVPGSVRWTQEFTDKLLLGLTGNMHLGLDDGSTDAENYVGSIDAAMMLLEGVELLAQTARSTSRYDLLSPGYETKMKGNAYFASLEASTDPDDMLHKDYFWQRAKEGDDFYAKTRLFFARMDEDFDSSLSNYRETRDDSYWSRHLTFYPSTYKNLPGTAPSMSEYDLESFATGNGIDQGRNVYAWRGDVSFWDGGVKGLLDTRYVTDLKDRHIETVTRTQWEAKATEKLTTKFMYLNHQLPRTNPDLDPFMVDVDTNEPYYNWGYPGGEDPSLNTTTLGARYELTQQIALHGVWEHTNDAFLATDNYPGSLLTGAVNGLPWTTADGRYRRMPQQALGRDYLGYPKYDYFDIFKVGLELRPTEQWMIYLDYTHNDNKFAGNIDDNMNHFGIETSFVPYENLGFFARYTYAKMYDIYSWDKIGDWLDNGQPLKYAHFHNFFFEARYFKANDMKLSLMYGVGPAYTTDVSTSNPSVAYYTSAVLETQHMVRMVYEKKF